MFLISEWESDGFKVYRVRKFTDPNPDKATIDRVIGVMTEKGASNAWAVKSKPSMRKLENAMMDGVCPTIVCNCRVEPDGHCQHGRPSILLAWGMI